MKNPIQHFKELDSFFSLCGSDFHGNKVEGFKEPVKQPEPKNWIRVKDLLNKNQ